MQFEICLAYLDDVVVKSQSFEGHLENLSLVFDRPKSAGLKLNPKKCKILKCLSGDILFLRQGYQLNHQKFCCKRLV